MIPALEALELLRAGNRRFATDASIHASRTGPERRGQLTRGQEPFAVILGCSDSRVPVEIIFDQGLGDLFVIRVAGNVVAPSLVGSVEFAAEKFGTRLVVVLGHTSCGAVAAAHAGGAVPGQISSLFQHIIPAIPEGASVNEAVEANVRYQVEALSRSSTVIREAIGNGTAAVHGAVYGLEDGRVRLVG